MNVLKTNGELDNDEIDAGVVALATVLPREEAERIHWARRLTLAVDGTYLLEFSKPRISCDAISARNPDLLRAPWHWPHAHVDDPTHEIHSNALGMVADAVYLPIAEAVAILSGDDSPEAEVRRRRKLLQDALESTKQEAENRIQARRDAAAALKREKEERPRRWAALPREVKIFYLAEERHPTRVQETLRILAGLFASGDINAHPVPNTFEPDLL